MTTPDNERLPSGQQPRKGFGLVEWAILLGIVGLMIYGQFFGGGAGGC